MNDRERLDEALGYMDWLRDVAADWPDVEEGGGVILAAARAYRDLLANGERVEWCETHETPEGDAGQCLTALEYPVSERCRIVSKLLVDPTTEEER